MGPGSSVYVQCCTTGTLYWRELYLHSLFLLKMLTDLTGLSTSFLRFESEDVYSRYLLLLQRVTCVSLDSFFPSLSKQNARLLTRASTNFLITCIALNLMLIVCFGVNPIEQSKSKILPSPQTWLCWQGRIIAMVHRWFNCSREFHPYDPSCFRSFRCRSDIQTMVCPLSHADLSPTLITSYLTPFEVDQRMRVVVLDVVLWALLSCVIASIAIIAVSRIITLISKFSIWYLQVLITLFKQGRNTAQALLRGNPINADLNSSDNTNRPACLFSWRSWGGRRSCSGSGDDSDNNDPKGSQPSESHHHHLQDKFLGIALKISLYPIFLIVANVVLSGE